MDFLRSHLNIYECISVICPFPVITFWWVCCCTHPKGHNIDSNFKQANQYPSCFETNSLWSIEAVKSLREELWNCTIVGHATACIGQFDNRNSNLLTCLIMWHSNRLSLDYFICKKVILLVNLTSVFIQPRRYLSSCWPTIEIWAVARMWVLVCFLLGPKPWLVCKYASWNSLYDNK